MKRRIEAQDPPSYLAAKKPKLSNNKNLSQMHFQDWVNEWFPLLQENHQKQLTIAKWYGSYRVHHHSKIITIFQNENCKNLQITVCPNCFCPKSLTKFFGLDNFFIEHINEELTLYSTDIILYMMQFKVYNCNFCQTPVIKIFVVPIVVY